MIIDDRFYLGFRQFGRFVLRQCLRTVVLHEHRANDRTDGYLLAVTHLSHVEPLLLSCIVDRPITWMARIEFFRVPVMRTILGWCNAICINRTGRPVKALRDAIAQARGGRVVGIFPEGGCRKGNSLAFRGGRIRQGVATIALKAQVPIVPVVVLGTPELSDIDPWLPGIRGKCWMAFGEPIHPPPRPPRTCFRTTRRRLAEQLEGAYVATYQDLLRQVGLADSMTP